MTKFKSRAVAVATIAALGSSLLVSAHAQTAKKPGLMSRIFHRNTMAGGAHRNTMAGGATRMSGNIVGNKKTHVFHLPGDRGALPEPQNRVYFRTAAQARAAGYHQAGQPTTHMLPHSHNTMSTSHGLLHRTH